MKHSSIVASHLLAFAGGAVFLLLIAQSQLSWDFAFGLVVVLALLGAAILEYRGRSGAGRGH